MARIPTSKMQDDARCKLTRAQFDRLAPALAQLYLITPRVEALLPSEDRQTFAEAYDMIAGVIRDHLEPDSGEKVPSSSKRRRQRFKKIGLLLDAANQPPP